MSLEILVTKPLSECTIEELHDAFAEATVAEVLFDQTPHVVAKTIKAELDRRYGDA